MTDQKRRRSLYCKSQLAEAVRAVNQHELTSVESTIRFHKCNPLLRIGAGRSSYLTPSVPRGLLSRAHQSRAVDWRKTEKADTQDDSWTIHQTDDQRFSFFE